MRNRFSLVLLLLLAFNSLSAQERDSMQVRKVIVHGLNDTKEWALSPAKWNGNDWLIVGGVSAATGALIAWGDQPIYSFANTLHNPVADKLAIGIEPMGHLYLAASISGFLLHGLLAKNNYSIETSLIAAESLILNTLMVQVVKNTASRNRPNNEGTTNPQQWNGPFFKGNSFFSGHTSAAFSVASVYAYRYRETTWVPILSYSLASLCGLQRIYGNRHWASDVLFGATAGTATGIFLCHRWEKNTIRFYPAALPGGAALSITIPIDSE